MKLRREFKIGVFAIVVILVSWWGIKWLGGQNLFKTYNTYYAYYEEVPNDLQVSSRVYIKGVNVGSVRDIELLKHKGDVKIKVEFTVENKYADMIPANSVALASEGMLGGAQIEIVRGDSKKIVADGGTLEGAVDAGLMGVLAEKGTQLIDGLNQTVEGVNTILGENSENIALLVANLEATTASINSILSSSEGDINQAMNDLSTFTSTLAANTSHLESMLENLDTFSGDLADADVVNQLTATVESLNGVLAAIESGDGTVGKLLNDEQLYNSLNDAGNNLALLLEDLKANPMRYVHFSLFGTSEEKVAQKAAKKEAKAAKRAAKVAEEAAEADKKSAEE